MTWISPLPLPAPQRALEAQKAAEEAALAEGSNAAEEAKAELARLQSASEKLRLAVLDAELSKGRLQQHVSGLEGEVGRLEGQKQLLEGQKELLDHAVTDATVECERLRRQLYDLEGSREAATAGVSTAASEAAAKEAFSLRLQLQGALADRTAALARVTELEGVVAAKEAALAKAKAEAAAAADGAKAASGLTQQLDSRLGDAVKEVVVLKERVRAAEAMAAHASALSSVKEEEAAASLAAKAGLDERVRQMSLEAQKSAQAMVSCLVCLRVARLYFGLGAWCVPSGCLCVAIVCVRSWTRVLLPPHIPCALYFS